MIRTPLIDTDDIGEAEVAVSCNFGPVKISARHDSSATSTRVWRTTAGPLVFDDVQYGYDMRFTMAAPTRIMLCRMRQGTMTECGRRGASRRIGPGEVIALGVDDNLPFAGAVSHSTFDMFVIDRALLGEVADRSAKHGQPVRLTGTGPASQAAGLLMADTMRYVLRGVRSNAHVEGDSILTGKLARYLASTMLEVFPHNLADRKAPTPPVKDLGVLIRRAMTFMEENADRDISPADIASAVGLQPGVLRMIFLQRDMTPEDYLRRVRLYRVHQQLIDSDPESSSVSEIARRWGFGHGPRFKFAYWTAFGISPNATLRDS